jgi:hypothetical protein
LNFRVKDLLKRWDTEDDSVIRQAIIRNWYDGKIILGFVQFARWKWNN